MDRKVFIKALRDAADVYELHEEIPVPNGIDLASWLHGQESVVTLADCARIPGARWDKAVSSWNYELSLTLAEEGYDKVKISLNAPRETVCTKRVVGTETVTVPAVEAKPEHTEERDIVEWDCVPLLAPRTAEV